MKYYRRGIGLSIVLSIITIGIYKLYWYYALLDDLYRINGKPSRAGTDLLLSIVTCGIYSVYMNYQMGKMVSEFRYRNGLQPRDDSILFLVLSLFGLSIINMCIVQSDLNDELFNVAEGSYYYPDINGQN